MIHVCWKYFVMKSFWYFFAIISRFFGTIVNFWQLK